VRRVNDEFRFHSEVVEMFRQHKAAGQKNLKNFRFSGLHIWNPVDNRNKGSAFE